MINKKLTTEIDKHVGERLRLRRSLLGVSQEKLAQELGISFQQVQKYEKGLNRIAAGRLFQISKMLATNVAYFFENLEQRRSDEIETQNYVSSNLEAVKYDLGSKETASLLRCYYTIKAPDKRISIIKFIKAISS